MKRDEALKKMQAVKSYMTSGNPIWSVTEIGEAFDMAIEALEAAEQKTGKWVGVKEYCDHLNEEAEREGKGNRYMPSGMNIRVYCNQCWEPNDRRTTYCPNCGARMVQEGEDNDS